MGLLSRMKCTSGVKSTMSNSTGTSGAHNSMSIMTSSRSSSRFHSCLALIVASMFLLVVVWTEDITPMNVPTERQMTEIIAENENGNDHERNVDDTSTPRTNINPIRQQEEDQRNKNKLVVDVTFAANDKNKVPVAPYQREDVIFGHIHMARTAGSSLNWILSNHFERVCGNKGYSYDAYKRRMPNAIQADVVTSIGFEDCDYISMEANPDFWTQFNHFHNTPMELHLPCREPIDYLMSLCNYEEVRGRADTFNCDGINSNSSDKDIANAVNECLRFIGRFDDKLNELDHVHLKCYDFKEQFKSYIEYMTTKLQVRRFVAEEPKKKEVVKTPWPRHRDEECIWKDEGLKKRVETYLVNEVPYFRYCNACIGSENELTRLDADDSTRTVEEEDGTMIKR